MEGAEEPRWLDDEERWGWYAFAYMMIRLPAALDAQLRRDADLTHFEYLVLSGLSLMPDRTQRLSDLARYTASAISRLSNVVGKLEARGWVLRTPDPDNGRYTLATLTEAGWRKVADAAPAQAMEVRRLVFDPLTKSQQRQMGRIAERILEAIDPSGKYCIPAPPAPEAQHRPS